MISKKNTVGIFMVMLAPMAYAGVAQTLPAGQIACQTRKDAANYALYVKQAPDFAQDLLARASCFKPEKAEEAVRIGEEKGYTQLKLLSGHNVWVPSKP